MRFEDEEGRRSLCSVADLCVFEDCYAEVVLGGQVGEFHVKFRGSIEQAAKFDCPLSISPFPTSGDVAAVANDLGFQDAGDIRTDWKGIQSG